MKTNEMKKYILIRKGDEENIKTITMTQMELKALYNLLQEVTNEYSITYTDIKIKLYNKIQSKKQQHA